MLAFREETNYYLSSVRWAFSSSTWVLLSRLRMRTVSWLGVSLAEAAIPRQLADAMPEAVGKPTKQRSRGQALWVTAGLAQPFWASPTNASLPCRPETPTAF